MLALYQKPRLGTIQSRRLQLFGRKAQGTEVVLCLCFQFFEGVIIELFLRGRKTVRICVPSSALERLILLDF